MQCTPVLECQANFLGLRVFNPAVTRILHQQCTRICHFPTKKTQKLFWRKGFVSKCTRPASYWLRCPPPQTQPPLVPRAWKWNCADECAVHSSSENAFYAYVWFCIALWLTRRSRSKAIGAFAAGRRVLWWSVFVWSFTVLFISCHGRFSIIYCCKNNKINTKAKNGT